MSIVGAHSQKIQKDKATFHTYFIGLIISVL